MCHPNPGSAQPQLRIGIFGAWNVHPQFGLRAPRGAALFTMARPLMSLFSV
jgi:hypothetical protein